MARHPGELRNAPFSTYVLIAILLALCGQALAQTDYIVNSNGDSPDNNPGDGACATGNFVIDHKDNPQPECTLSAAIQEGNQTSGDVVIEFAVYVPVQDGITTIETTGLDPVENNLTIDGHTHPAYDENDGIPTVVILQGLSTLPAHGLVIEDSGAGSVIRGLAIAGFAGDGIRVRGGGNYAIENNWIGLYWKENEFIQAGNLLDGLRLISVTGATVHDNFISDNLENGISLLSCHSDCTSANATRDVTISANTIGLTPVVGDFLAPSGNQGSGVHIGPDNETNFIGPSSESNSNHIAANGVNGITINSDDQIVRNNRIGVPQALGIASGFSKEDYGHDIGIRIRGSRNQVGGLISLPGGGAIPLRNIIGNSSQNGIHVNGADMAGLTSDDNQIQENLIGVDELGNDHGQDYAIRIASGTGNTVSDATIENNGVGIFFVSADSGLNEAIRNVIIGNSVGVLFQRSGLLGGDSIDDANIIGDSAIGVSIATIDNSDVVQVFNNFIGTDENQQALGNTRGIQVNGPALVEIGNVGRGNVIGNSSSEGILLIDGASSVSIQSNRIGVHLDGGMAPNTTGVRLEAHPSDGPFNNVIGYPSGWPIDPENWSPGNGRGNIIAFSGGAAIDVTAGDQNTTGNVIRGNKYYFNSGRAIDLGMAELDDTGGTQDGPNIQMNFPVFDADNTFFDVPNKTIEFRYHVWMSTSEATYPVTVDFYLSDGNPGDAFRFLGTDTYPEEMAQTWKTGSLPLPLGADPSGQNLVATATDDEGNTSQFTMQPIQFKSTEPEIFQDRFEAP